MRHAPYILLTVLIPTLAAYAQDATPTTNVGGYGEIHYTDPDGRAAGTLDLSRFVLYVGRQFSDRISFYSETEVEHTVVASDKPEGEVSIEQAYLEYRLGDRAGLRAGIVLAPVGFVNLSHEPTAFNGVARPALDERIIPTTWSEIGVGAYAKPTDDVDVQAYLIGGLRAEGFDAAEGIREGRQEGALTSTANPGLVARVGWMPLAGLSLGVSAFHGNSTGDADSLGGGAVTVLAADARYTIGRLALRAEAATISIADADRINAVYGGDVGSRLDGWYVEAAYNALPLLAADTGQELVLFGRWGRTNTQAETRGLAASSAMDVVDVTFGCTYRPVPEVVVKLDYQWFTDAASNTAKRLEAGIGYAFF